MVRVSTTILIRFFSCRIVERGIGLRDAVDRLVLDRGHHRGAGADADGDDVGGLEPALGRPVVDQHVGLRARRGDAELHALDIGRSLDLLGDVVAQADGELHAAADQGEALDGLAALLHADRVLVGAGHHVGAAAHQGLERLGAALEVVDLDVEARVLEEALGLGDRDRQVIERRLAADRQHQLGLLGLARLCPRHVRRGHQSRGCRQNRTAPHCSLVIVSSQKRCGAGECSKAVGHQPGCRPPVPDKRCKRRSAKCRQFAANCTRVELPGRLIVPLDGPTMSVAASSGPCFFSQSTTKSADLKPLRR